MPKTLQAPWRIAVPPVVATLVVLPVGYAIAKFASWASNQFLANDAGNGTAITAEKLEAMAVFFPLLLLALAVMFVGGPVLAKRIRDAQRRRAR